MKKALLFLFCLLSSHFLFAQWVKSTSDTNNIYNSNSGYVGIGTTSPSSALHVVGNFNLAGNMDILSDVFYLGMSTAANNFTYQGIMQPTYGLQWAPDPWLSGTATGWLSGYGGLKFFSNNTMQMYIDYNGRVGIGSNGGTDKVNINTALSGGETIIAGTSGNSIFSGGHALQCESSNYTGGIGISVGANNSGFIQAYSPTQENGNIYINPNGGNVGIGTTHPQSLLSVSGTITAKVLNVTQNNWSDFVFDSSYHRQPLADIARYVAEHKHLPEIPSAAQIATSGLDIGNMQKLQLQKIEELTLDVIDADKRAQQQDSLLLQQQALLQQMQAQLKAQQEEIELLKRKLGS